MPSDGAIRYTYDRELLTEIVYPKNVQNKVNYTYGAPDAPYNRAARVYLVQDASGGQEFFYGALGEVTKTIRTVQMGESDMRTWIWSASYDSWNRVQTMTYPDGEKVTYHYNQAGNLSSMDGEKLGRTYNYLSRVGYDKYEKQVYLQYGNGAVTTYNYEPERQRLLQMGVTSNNKQLMNNTYTYDALNNILGITNSAAATGDIGGSTLHVYSYNDLNRLVSASGNFKGNKDTSVYTLAMQYNNMGNIIRKNQQHFVKGKVQSSTTHDLNYKYGANKPNAASQIGDRTFTYDENGNQTFWQDSANNYRLLTWDEENRLSQINDNGYINRYVYDASGERVIKSHGGSQGVYINGAPAGIVNHTDNNYTVYVSPYFTLHDNKFTKHYYAGSARITRKIGNGQFENQYRPGVFEISAGSINYINRQQQISASKKEYIKQRGIPPGPPTMKGIYAEPEFTGKALPNGSTPDTIAPAGWPKKPVFAPAGGPPGAPIQWGDNVTNNTVAAGFGYIGNGNIEEELRYFYHSDHLGSTSYITNAKGDITQFVAYMPFGESFMEQHTAWDSPYKFNAKELDGETGLYYYGARYYDARTSVWASVDPLAELDRAWSLYNYARNNPIRFIDADGMFWGDFLDENGKKLGSDGKDDGKLYVVKTAQKNFDSGAPSAGITKDQAKATSKFISENSGSTSAFEANNIAYENSVEIAGSSATRQSMVDIVNQDNGRGGTVDANNREYGGVIKSDGTVSQSPAGPVANPLTDPNAHIDIASFAFQSTFHSHPSGNISTGPGSNTIGGTTTSASFRNAPSNVGGDVGNSGSKVNYVFSRGNGVVYIYNNSGVQATIPQKYFVTPNVKK